MPDNLFPVLLLQCHSVFGRVDGGQLRYPRAVLPYTDGVVVRADDMRLRHVDVVWLDVDVLGVHWCSNGVAEDEDVHSDFVRPCGKHTEVPEGLYTNQSLDELHRPVPGLRVKEHNTVLHPVGDGEGVYEGTGEVAPQVVRADVGEVDERLYRDGKAQASASFPAQPGDARARHLERAEVASKGVVELNLTDILIAAAVRCRSGDG
mmetsp:Transcript_39932/g.125426  ORF Transcript_39932/g.125426 Transcript_39932/m.125426 type:complete len:206 (-) Transcript_39932:979-1596(-)